MTAIATEHGEHDGTQLPSPRNMEITTALGCHLHTAGDRPLTRVIRPACIAKVGNFMACWMRFSEKRSESLICTPSHTVSCPAGF